MTILVGYDASDHAQRAVDRAVEEATLRGVPLHVLAVLEHEQGDSPTRVKGELAVADALERELVALRDRLRSDGLEVHVEIVHGRRGDVARDLLDAAKALHAELIVIGIRRRSPVGKLVMGSKSQQILLGADCPVLAVRSREADD